MIENFDKVCGWLRLGLVGNAWVCGNGIRGKGEGSRFICFFLFSFGGGDNLTNLDEPDEKERSRHGFGIYRQRFKSSTPGMRNSRTISPPSHALLTWRKGRYSSIGERCISRRVCVNEMFPVAVSS